MDVKKIGELSGHKQAIYSLTQLGERNFLSAGADGMIIKWDIEDNTPGILAANVPKVIYSLGLIGANNFLAAGTRGGVVFILDLQGKKQIKQIQLDGDVFILKVINDHLVCLTSSGSIYWISIENFEIENSIKAGLQSGRCIDYSPEMNAIATGWSDNHIRVFDSQTQKQINDFEAHENSVFCLKYISNSDCLISGGRDARLRLWATKNDYAEIDAKPAHWYTINSLAISPDGRLFSTGSRDKTIKIWDALSFDLLKVIERPKFEAHTHSVNTLIWSSFNNTLVSAGDDRRILLWNVENF